MVAKEIKRIAIVFSGGLSRGAAQLSFAHEIIKKVGIERICCTTGSSIGALNAYAVSVDNTSKLLDIYNNLDCDNTRKFMKKIRNDFFSDAFNQIEKEKILMPAYVTSTNMAGIECNYFCLNSMPRDDLKACVNLSMAFPIVNGPQRFNHHWWLDGGVTDNVPTLPATYFDPDMVIILHCYSRYYPPESLFDRLRKDAIVIDVDVTLPFPERLSPFSFSKTEFQTMLRAGQEEGKNFSDFIFSDFYAGNVKERCFKYINDKMELRHKKSWNGLLEVVDILNALYQLKEGTMD